MSIRRKESLPTIEDAQLWEPREVAAVLRVSERTLKSWRHKGCGPKYVMLNQRLVRYDPRDILEYRRRLLAVHPLR